jgi:hypothetical protein
VAAVAGRRLERGVRPRSRRCRLGLCPGRVNMHLYSRLTRERRDATNLWKRFAREGVHGYKNEASSGLSPSKTRPSSNSIKTAETGQTFAAQAMWLRLLWSLWSSMSSCSRTVHSPSTARKMAGASPSHR